MWYKLNWIYVWNQKVRPAPQLQKSIDLRGKTLAQVQAEWWDINYWGDGSYVIDENGLWNTGGNNNAVQLYYYFSSGFTSSNKVTLRLTWNTPRNSELATVNNLWLQPVINTAWNNGIAFNYHSWSNTAWGITSVYYDGSPIWSSGSQDVGGDTNMEFSLDFSTWVYSATITTPVSFTWSWTLTSSQISNILTQKYIVFTLCSFARRQYPKIKTVDFILY